MRTPRNVVLHGLGPSMTSTFGRPFVCGPAGTVVIATHVRTLDQPAFRIYRLNAQCPSRWQYGHDTERSPWSGWNEGKKK